MAYEEKEKGKGASDKPQFRTSAEVLAGNQKAAKGLQASIDAAPHPHPISAKHDEAELKMRARQHKKR
jgi:hypothetical protein